MFANFTEYLLLFILLIIGILLTTFSILYTREIPPDPSPDGPEGISYIMGTIVFVSANPDQVNGSINSIQNYSTAILKDNHVTRIPEIVEYIAAQAGKRALWRFCTVLSVTIGIVDLTFSPIGIFLIFCYKTDPGGFRKNRVMTSRRIAKLDSKIVTLLLYIFTTFSSFLIFLTLHLTRATSPLGVYDPYWVTWLMGVSLFGCVGFFLIVLVAVCSIWGGDARNSIFSKILNYYSANQQVLHEEFLLSATERLN